MKDAIRPAGAALAAFAFLTGTAACATPAAPEPQRTLSAPSRPPGDQQLAEVAAEALSDPDALDEAGTFVLSATGAVEGTDSRSRIAPGTPLVVEAACVGEGSVTLTVTSGRATARQRLACAGTPHARTFALTTRAGSIAFTADRGPATRGGLAYLARRPASEQR
ncbi:hypothetical protein [Streptomyces albidochromogenes]|uniref:Lipoprotein n=1 Tax=Streptomyces albidochromogenes TaxID=329524 RepID=A0ABW6FIV6_9ACTN